MIDFVILDECHHAFSPTCEFLQERDNGIIKLTATLHTKENINDVIYYFSLRKAISLGYLNDYKIVCKIFQKDDNDDDRFNKLFLYVKNRMQKDNYKRLIGYCRNVSDKQTGKTYLDEMT